jgi:hypothetical protein
VTLRPLAGLVAGLALGLWPAPNLGAGRAMPDPVAYLGFAPCADYKLATYEAIDAYLQALDQASDRMTLVEIGRSVGGRPLRLAAISSARNLARLDRYKAIAAALARGRHPDGRPVSETDARALAREGRAVVWVDFGLHSSEVAHAQAAPLFAWRMVSGESPELQRLRDDVILLLMPNMNPDGTTQVAEWYMRHVGTPYERASLPELYHHYIGHDNNRDWYMLTQPESRAVARQLYHEWFPQILHNQHQEAPFPARIFVPPFDDPVNPNIPPLVVRGINTVGDAITRRLEQEGKPGAVSRVQFDAWWNGGMRTAPYFHNMVGILTETAHASASPATYDTKQFPAAFANGVSTSEPSMYYPAPYRGGRWTQSDSCEYMLTASMAVIDIGARRREEWLFDIWRMGQDQVRAGADETFVVPAAQWDAPTAAAMIDTLSRGGVEIEQATSPFTAEGRSYDAGSYVIRGAQPFRAYVRDLLLPQKYPDLRLYPGGPPDRPYDITGWTLPLQMGVRVDEIRGPVTVASRSIDLTTPLAATAGDLATAPVIAIDARVNQSVRLVNRLLSAGVPIERLATALGTGADAWPAGTFLVTPDAAARALLVQAADDLGLTARGLETPPPGDRRMLTRTRIGLYRPWGGNMDEGWTRYVLDEFGFPYVTLRDADLRAGNLAAHVDVVVLPDLPYDSMLRGLPSPPARPEHAGGMGARGVSALYDFVESGGTLVTLDSASELPLTAFGLPVTNALAGVRDSDVFIPGSLLKLDVDTAHPLAWGMPAQAAAFYAQGLAFAPSATRGRGEPPPAWSQDVRVVASYGSHPLLLSGWQLGGGRLEGRAAIVEARVGAGRVVLVGFRVQHRAQAHGTFKFLFNALLTPGSDAQPTQ